MLSTRGINGPWTSGGLPFSAGPKGSCSVPGVKGDGRIALQLSSEYLPYSKLRVRDSTGVIYKLYRTLLKGSLGCVGDHKQTT